MTGLRRVARAAFEGVDNVFNCAFTPAWNPLYHLGTLGFDPQFGARPLKRVIQRQVLNGLSKEILSVRIQKDSVVSIELNEEQEIEFVNIDKVEALKP